MKPVPFSTIHSWSHRIPLSMVLSAGVAYDAAAKVAAVWQDLTRLKPKSARFHWPSAHLPTAAGTARIE
jgi:hypothetical protein